MGSKRRIADKILPIILKVRKPNQWYVEPFCGGCNTLERVTGKRMAGDIHPELIAMYKALQGGWKPPLRITEEGYKRIMKLGSPELKGYAGFTHSFGGKYGGTYRRGTDQRIEVLERGNKLKGNYNNISHVGKLNYRLIMDHAKLLRDVKFYCCAYYDLPIPPKSILYLDPPYEGTTKYNTKLFMHSNFWNWCRNMKGNGHSVFISEYNAPDDFKIVWQQELKTNLNAHSAKAFGVVEKLFTL